MQNVGLRPHVHNHPPWCPISGTAETIMIFGGDPFLSPLLSLSQTHIGYSSFLERHLLFAIADQDSSRSSQNLQTAGLFRLGYGMASTCDLSDHCSHCLAVSLFRCTFASSFRIRCRFSVYFSYVCARGWPAHPRALLMYCVFGLSRARLRYPCLVT
jgi:hypothetical protein